MTPARLRTAIAALSDRPVYPPVLGAAAILAAFGTTYLPLSELWRPLIVTVSLGVALTGIAGQLTRHWHESAFLVSLAILAVVGLWQLVAAACVMWLGVAWLRARRHTAVGPTPALARPLNILASAWLFVAFVGAVVAAVPPRVPVTEAVELTLPSNAPNIYVVLLDGYPRADTLQRYFGYDNGPFVADLEVLGFEVKKNSASDYSQTLWTVPAMLHMRSAEALGILPWAEGNDARRRVRELINAAPVLRSLERAGYTTYSLLSPSTELGIRSAERIWQSPSLSAFESHLIQEGALNVVATEFLYSQHRASVLDAFAELERIAADAAEPRLTYVHIMSPHAPFAFAADGSAAQPAPCEPGCGLGATQITVLGQTLDGLSQTFVGQVEFLNGHVLDLMGSVVEADPQAVIVLFSDHGSRLDVRDYGEWTANLFAARTPGHEDAFDDVKGTTLLFAAIFNAYFDADIQVDREQPAVSPP